MNSKERKEIQDLAGDTLDLVRAARSVTRDIADQSARQVPTAALTDLLNQNSKAHARASEKSAQLAAAIKAAQAPAWETSAQLLVEKTAAAQQKAGELPAILQAAPPVSNAVAAALKAAFDADDEAESRMVDFRSRIEKSDEAPGKPNLFFAAINSLKENAGAVSGVVGTLIGTGIVGIIVFMVLLSIYRVLANSADDFLTRISQIEVARGLIHVSGLPGHGGHCPDARTGWIFAEWGEQGRSRETIFAGQGCSHRAGRHPRHDSGILFCFDRPERGHCSRNRCRHNACSSTVDRPHPRWC
jgi:hypothetical protein